MTRIILSRIQATARELAGDAEDTEIESIIYLTLTARGMGSADAKEAAGAFASAALEARRRIREETAYEIVVNDDEGA